MNFRRFSIILLAALAVPSYAYAIPSPDVIVNVFASAGQVLGLLSVLFGASFFGKYRERQ